MMNTYLFHTRGFIHSIYNHVLNRVVWNNLQPLAVQSSNFKRPVKLNLQQNHILLLRDKLEENRELTFNEWSELRHEILSSDRQINKVNIDASILGQCLPNGQLQVAKSYIRYLKTELGQQPNIATIGRLLRLYYLAYANGKLVNNEHQEILEMYGKSDVILTFFY